MRVLCTGDIHIGRRSSRLPASVDSQLTSAASAWNAIVNYAIDQQVDVVALSGDVVDQENRYFESLGPLERGLRRLGEAGIRTVAVAGNHDYNVLPALAKALPPDCLTLLGVGGEWQRVQIHGKDGKSLYVDGWSFPTQHVADNPIASYAFSKIHDAPVLGLLHADLDTVGGTYASVSLAELQAKPVSFWLLGHIHAPRLCRAEGKPTVLYPGSPQPLDPGESGSHGAWLLDLTHDGSVPPRLVPLGTVLYESISIDVSESGDIDALRDTVVNEVRRSADAAMNGSSALRYISLRVQLTGRCRFQAVLSSEMDRMVDDLDLEVRGAQVNVERVEITTRPDYDLEQLARGADVPGVLAKLIRELEQVEAEGAQGPAVSAAYDPLLQSLCDIPRTLQAAKPYKSLRAIGSRTETPELHGVLKRQAMLLLDELMSQQEVTA